MESLSVYEQLFMKEKARKLECSKTKQQLRVQRSSLAAKEPIFLSAERLSDYKTPCALKMGKIC